MLAAVLLAGVLGAGVVGAGVSTPATAATETPAVAPATPSPASPAGEDGARTFPGPSYGADVDAPPTADRPQSKLWFHDDAWWALMLEERTGRTSVHELLPDHTWRPSGEPFDEPPGTTYDVVADGDRVYAASSSMSTRVRVSRLDYDAGTRTYRRDSGFPVQLADRGSRSVSIDQDSTGRLWATYTSGYQVWVTHSTGDTTWAAPAPLPGAEPTASSEDLSSVVAFAGSVGILWSDEVRGAYRFAVRRDDHPVTAWTGETPIEGPGLSDDHISLVADEASGVLYAAVKTAQGDRGEPPESPLILVLERDPDGTWTRHVAGTVGDRLSQPILQLDGNARELHLFVSAAGGGGGIFTKTSPLSRLDFAPGRGEPFATWPGSRLSHATAGPGRVTPETGIVVLAVSRRDGQYFHAELALPRDAAAEGTPGAAPPPSPPRDLTGTARDATAVHLFWWPGEPVAWRPAGEVAARTYAVYRDGTLLEQTEFTSFHDTTAQPGRRHTYAVEAVDAAGSRSPRSDAVAVETPVASAGPAAVRDAARAAPVAPVLLAVALLGGVAFVAARAATRRHR